MTETLRDKRAQRAIAFVTMGCAKNEVDSELMQRKLRSAGYTLTDEHARADAIIINTCSFIQSATEESLEAIFDAAGLPNVAEGNALLIVAGCMPARYGDELACELTEAHAFVPCSSEDDIVAILDTQFEKIEAVGDRGVSRWTSDDLCQESAEEAGEANACASKVSAYVKISDGCDRFCSYCTIPYIRGRYHSFSYEQIYADVSEQVSCGVREIVLIAQDTGRYGNDFENPTTLAWLLSQLAEAYPQIWFRVMYIQPEGITDELLETLATHENICSYFDIPLQHVDSQLLRAMHRKGSRAEFSELCARIKRRIPDVSLRTTLIAGFPGESDEQFEELCDFVEDGLFDYVGVFAYSREEGTRAYDLDNQIDDEVKAARAQRLRDVADAACTPNISARIGQVMQVLIEGCEEDGQLFGRAMCQAPEVDGVTYVNKGHIGEVVRVSISDTLLYEMEGELL